MRSFAIIPAAGLGTRMQTPEPKLLLPWGHTTIIEQTLSAWRAGGVSERIVIVRPNDMRIAEVARAAGAQVVLPDAPPPEMKISVEWGLRYILSRLQPRPEDVWLLAPADMPTLSPQVIQALLGEHDPSSPAVIVPSHGGRTGHPVLLPWPLAEQVSALKPDEGINVLVKRGPSRFVELGEQAIPADVDTPADYERAIALSGS